jgi:CheY-like chemotaxis protein
MMSVAPFTITNPARAAVDSYVLLVDDHEPSLRQLKELVKLSGHACIATNSGSEALNYCERSRPRVVVTDLTMPNLDGRALARWLQSRHPSVPIILMTGQTFDTQSLDELERVFTAILPKPIDVDRLLGLLGRLMPAAPNRPLGPGRT